MPSLMYNLLHTIKILHEDCGIIHNDLSLNNILCCHTDTNPQILLIDFGNSEKKNAWKKKYN